MARVKPDPVPPVDLAEAARMLRVLLEALPPATAGDRATARRIEGAAIALDVAALESASLPPA